MIVYLIISFVACLVGAICGIGGGVMVKPILDLFRWTSVATVSFFTSCMVLAMTCWSVGRSIIAKDNIIKLKDITPIAVGGAVGGVIGSYIFNFIKNQFTNHDFVGSLQSALLMLVSIAILLYSVFKEKIKPHHLTDPFSHIIIGLVIGVASSFLGIGGGHINLVVLYFFFGMNSKEAAANSLYIILISKITQLVATAVTGNIPEFDWLSLNLMIFGAIAGSAVGRVISKRISNKGIDRLFNTLMVLVIIISGYNIWQYIV